MVTIRNNVRHPIELSFIGENNRPEKIYLLSGINLSVDDNLWNFAQNHPVVKLYLDNKTLEPLLKTPRVEGELENLPVVTSKQNDEPLLVTENGKPAKKTRG